MDFQIDYSDRKPLGKSKETTSAIGLGTWAIRNYRIAKEVFVEAVRDGIDLIDTAEIYDSGRAERFVGDVVKEVGRDNVFIVTKLPPSRFISEEEALRAAHASLQRLGVRYADLVLIHWPGTSISVEVQARNLEKIAEEGLTRYIGVSNFSKEEIERTLWALRKHEIVVDQVHYSVIYRDVEKALLPYAIKEGITIQAYTPIEKGRVVYIDPIEKLADKYGKPPVAIALNYLISRPRVVAIVKTENFDHLKEIEEALGWRMKKEDIDFLSRI